MSEVLEKVGRYADSGQTRLYLQTLDLHDLEHLRLVAEEIKPRLRPALLNAGAFPIAWGHDVPGIRPALRPDADGDGHGVRRRLRRPRGHRRIASYLVEHGHDGVVVSGTTGESPTTTVSEDGDILRAVIDAVGDRACVVAGVGTNATAHSVEARPAEKLGADGLLLVTPYYNKPGQAGVLHHFRSVVESTGVPVMLYDVPGRTATQIDLDTYAAAKEWDTVVAVKDAVGTTPAA